MLIQHGTLVLENEIVAADLRVENGVIAEIGPLTAAPGETLYDASGLLVCPGLIDKHTHGALGFDFMDNSEQAYHAILSYQASVGVTGVVASTVAAPFATLEETLAFARERMQNPRPGEARLLGVHLEGPYLSVKNRGAHAKEALALPASGEWHRLLAYADVIKDITVSPELAGAPEMIRAFCAAGITVSGGHDDAILPDILAAKEAGMSNLTHLYCAMSEAVVRGSMRYVGLREYGLIDDTLTAELIADNHHITPELAKMILRCKSPDTLCIVSDALRPAGTKPDGTLFLLGAQAEDNQQFFKVGDGVAVMAEGGRFAGSIQPVSQMLRNLVKDCGVSLSDAVRMASLVPARIIHEDRDIGSLAVGKRADLCLLDSALQVKDTLIGGQLLCVNI